MKKVFLTAIVAAAFAFGMSACCGNAPAEQTTDSTEVCCEHEHECCHQHQCTCEDTTCCANHCENCTNENCCCKAQAGDTACCQGKHECCKAGHEGCEGKHECCKKECPEKK